MPGILLLRSSPLRIPEDRKTILPPITMATFVFFALALWGFSGVISQEATEVDCGRYHLGKGGHVLCNRMYRPVCGTDDKTYPSECEMCRQILELGVKVAKKHDQRCISDICQQYSSNRGMCTLEYSPHCGSDNKIYSNLCDFCTSALKSGGTLFLKHPGPCRAE